jgi:type II secretory pathway pseudopilin PulG
MVLKRNAMTLVEVLVLCAIMMIVLALLLPAIQRVRNHELRLESTLNLKALMQGLQQYAMSYSGKLPGASLNNLVMDARRYPLRAALPHLDIGYREPWGQMGPRGWEYPQTKKLISPTDPSVTDPVMPMTLTLDNSSYSTNAQVFDGLKRMSTISDGLAYTMGISERYRGCYNYGVNHCAFVVHGVYPILEPGYKHRTATFADSGYGDVIPVTVNGVSSPSMPNATFQVMPTVEEADGRVLQATQPLGLLTIMMDGSIRTFSPGVKASVFWGAVTPSGNEIISLE